MALGRDDGFVSPPGRVAVIGAGLAGLACARALADRRVDVVVFDKGRSPGGRLATRRQPPDTFDLGAQYFTVRDPRFRAHVDAWLARGVCAPWQGRIVALDDDGRVRPTSPIERLVGTPGMSALARDVAAELGVVTGHRVDRIERVAGGFVLRGSVAPAGTTLPPRRAGEAAGEVELGAFDGVALCLPADQAAELVEPVSGALAREARAVPLVPCIAVGLAAGPGDHALRALPFDGAFLPSTSPLSWVARDSSKPGRPPGERWVLHASAAWSSAASDLPLDDAKAALIAELCRRFDLGTLAPATAIVHRWRYAQALHPIDRGALFDDELRIGLGGDWALGGRVEGAVLSGVALASRVLGPR